MKLDQLHYFVETAKRQHIGQAAHFLRITPSAISHSITALEEELGKALFTKKGRQIKLTAHGQALLNHAEFLLAEVQRIREALATDQLKMSGHYCMAAAHALCADFLTPIWIEMQKAHPTLTASLYSLRSTEVVSRVDSGEVDLGFCFSPHSGPHHQQEIIYEGKLVFCFGKKHPFLKTRRLKDIEQYPSMAAQESQGIENCENHHAFQKFKIRPNIVNFFDHYDVAVSAIKSNAVWALLPDFVAYRHRADIETYVPRGWDANYVISAIWPKHHRRAQTVDHVIEKMREAMQQLQKMR